MAITYYMLQIPPWLFFSVLILSFGFLSAILTLIFRKYFKVQILKSHNEVTGFLFLATASFYALFLSFIMLVVWEQRNETHANISNEGSAALGVYRDIKYYPDSTVSANLMTVYLDFVYKVVDEEFPLMAKMESSRATSEAFNKVFYEIERLNPETPFHVQLVGEMFGHLNELARCRSLRITTMEAEISPALWLPIILGWLITILCCVLLDIEHKRMNISLNFFLGAIIGVFLFTIIILDHPYTGETKIEPKSYLQIFTLEEWSNETVPETIQSN
jgi:hypothetical protein